MGGRGSIMGSPARIRLMASRQRSRASAMVISLVLPKVAYFDLWSTGDLATAQKTIGPSGETRT